MKFFMSTIVASLAPTACNALIGISWKVDNLPSGGLKDMTFPINMAKADHECGYYYAMQFAFQNMDSVGYTGLQPRPDQQGRSVVHAAFSSFQDGASTTHPSCHGGADGGPGVSCAIDIFGNYSSTYELVVENTSGTTWTGTMIDSSTGQHYDMGAWTLPSKAGGILSSQVGFVEYYPWNSGTHECKDLPKTEATFGLPTTETRGSGTVILGDAYEYGDCVGEVAATMYRSSAGVTVDVGF